MRSRIVILLVLILIFVPLIIFRNAIAKSLVLGGVKKVTGLELEIKSMDIGILKPYIRIDGLKLFNFPNFTDRIMVDLPELYISYDLGAFLKKKVHLKEVRLDLREFVVEKNQKGELNVDSFKAIEEKIKGTETVSPTTITKKEEKKRLPETQIDILELKIGKVIYKDYTEEPMRIQEFNININERYQNISDLNSLVRLVVMRALTNITISTFSGLISDTLKSGVGNIGEAGDILSETIKKTTQIPTENIKKTVEDLKSIFEPSSENKP